MLRTRLLAPGLVRLPHILARDPKTSAAAEFITLMSDKPFGLLVLMDKGSQVPGDCSDEDDQESPTRHRDV